MGSSGSGRWNCHRKAPTVERCRVIELAAVTRAGVPAGTLRWFRGGTETASVGYTLTAAVDDQRSLGLTYRLTDRTTGAASEIVYRVALERVPIPRGGHKWWGRCPLSVDGRSCGRRVAKLYMPPGASYFGCRTCFRLTYASRQEHDGRVGALLKDPDALRRIANAPTGVGVAALGLALQALTAQERQYENWARRNVHNVGLVRDASPGDEKPQDGE